MTNDSNPTLEEVLTLFVVDNDLPTRAHVLDFVERYPNYQKEIVEFAATWIEQESLPEAPDDPELETLLARRMESFVLNQLFDVGGAPPGTGITATLHNLAERSQRSLQDIARELNLDLGVVQQLNARLVVPETIPDEVTTGIASYLAASVEQVYQALAGPQRRARLAVAARSGAPGSLLKRSFAEVVTSAANEENDNKGCDDAQGVA